MFLQNVWTAFSQVIILVLLASIGFFAHKGGLYTEDNAKKCNGLLFYIVTPGVICHSFLQLERSAETLKLFGLSLLGGFVFHLLGVALSFLLFRSSSSKGLYRYAAIYGNMGFMGVPLSQAVLGNTGVFIFSVMIFIFNLFTFTHGAAIMRSDKSSKFGLRQLLINPGTIGIALGLPLFLLNVSLPQILLTPLTHVSNLNTPLAMIMLGTYLADTKFSEIFKVKENYTVLFVKLILLPAVTIVSSYFLGVRGELLIGYTLMSCVPTATNTVMFAAQFGQSTRRAGMTIAMNNVCSIITMPIWIALAQSIA